jgi:hypothetical protein
MGRLRALRVGVALGALRVGVALGALRVGVARGRCAWALRVGVALERCGRGSWGALGAGARGSGESEGYAV